MDRIFDYVPDLALWLTEWIVTPPAFLGASSSLNHLVPCLSVCKAWYCRFSGHDIQRKLLIHRYVLLKPLMDATPHHWIPQRTLRELQTASSYEQRSEVVVFDCKSRRCTPSSVTHGWSQFMDDGRTNDSDEKVVDLFFWNGYKLVTVSNDELVFRRFEELQVYMDVRHEAKKKFLSTPIGTKKNEARAAKSLQRYEDKHMIVLMQPTRFNILTFRKMPRLRMTSFHGFHHHCNSRSGPKKDDNTSGTQTTRLFRLFELRRIAHPVSTSLVTQTNLQYSKRHETIPAHLFNRENTALIHVVRKSSASSSKRRRIRRSKRTTYSEWLGFSKGFLHC